MCFKIGYIIHMYIVLKLLFFHLICVGHLFIDLFASLLRAADYSII